MREQPLVSILIPLYNAEAYFSETLKSMLAQTYENIEIIIVNDGSTDDSLQIAREYEKKYSHVKVYSQENSGGQVARNKAFSLSKGQYIQYFDADDIIDVEKIKKQMDILEQLSFPDDILVSGRWGYFTSNDIQNTIFPKFTINKNYSDTLEYFIDAWSKEEYIVGPAWLIPRAINERIGGWDTELLKNQDGEFLVRVIHAAKQIVYVPESIMYYRQDSVNSIRRDKSKKRVESELRSCDKYMKTVSEHLDNKELRQALAMRYSSFIEVYYPQYKDLIKIAETRVKELGFEKPLISFNPSFTFIVNIVGLYTGLRLRRIKVYLSNKMKELKGKE